MCLRRHLLLILLAGLAAACGPRRPTPRVDRDPNSPATLRLRDQALRQVRAWYAKSPRLVVVDFKTADRLLGERKIEAARNAYLRILGWWPEGPHRRVAEFWMGYCEELLGSAPEARHLYHTVVATGPEPPDTWTQVAQRRLARLPRRD